MSLKIQLNPIRRLPTLVTTFMEKGNFAGFTWAIGGLTTWWMTILDIETMMALENSRNNSWMILKFHWIRKCGEITILCMNLDMLWGCSMNIVERKSWNFLNTKIDQNSKSSTRMRTT